MTAQEFLENEYGIIIKNEKALIHSQMLIKAMSEFAKYCAEQAWKAKGSITVYYGDFEDWWLYFIKKETTE